jgi:hypothetical protein
MNIRLGFRQQAVTNTLAYDGRKLTTAVKSFIGFAADKEILNATQ